MKLSLSLSSEVVELAWLGDETRGQVVEIAAGLSPRTANVDVIVVDDDHIRSLNREFRGKDKPTDVITFEYGDVDSDEDVIGEIFVSHQTIAKEANSLGVTPQVLFARIVVHGLMHVRGMVHDTDDAAAKMEAAEIAALEGRLSPSDIAALF